MELSAGEWLLVSLTQVAGGLLQGSVGFGLNLVAVPVLVLVDPRLVPGPALLSGLTMSALMAYRDRAAVDIRAIRGTVVGRVLGSVAGGVAVAAVASATGLTVLASGTILAGVVLSVLGWRLAPTRPTLFVAGGCSGFMSTTAALGGPPLALVHQRSTAPTLRGFFAGYNLVGVLISLATLAALGQLAGEDLRLSAYLLPGLLIGFGLSGAGARSLDRTSVRVVTLSVAAGAALLALARAALSA